MGAVPRTSDEIRARQDPPFAKARFLHAADAGAAGACLCAFICRNNRSLKFTQLSHGIARELRKQQANLECEIAELEQVWRRIPTNRECAIFLTLWISGFDYNALVYTLGIKFASERL